MWLGLVILHIKNLKIFKIKEIIKKIAKKLCLKKRVDFKNAHNRMHNIKSWVNWASQKSPKDEKSNNAYKRRLLSDQI